MNSRGLVIFAKTGSHMSQLTLCPLPTHKQQETKYVLEGSSGDTFDYIVFQSNPLKRIHITYLVNKFSKPIVPLIVSVCEGKKQRNRQHLFFFCSSVCLQEC